MKTRSDVEHGCASTAYAAAIATANGDAEISARGCARNSIPGAMSDAIRGRVAGLWDFGVSNGSSPPPVPSQLFHDCRLHDGSVLDGAPRLGMELDKREILRA